MINNRESTMRRMAALFILAVLSGGCVSSSDPNNGAVRLLNAVRDAPRMNLLIDEELRIAGVSFAGGSAFVTERRGDYRVRIEEVLPPVGSELLTGTIYDQAISWSANDEITFVVAGEAASDSEEIIEVRSVTRAVPFGRTRLQFVHAAVGGAAVDVYVTDPDTVLSAVAPIAPALAYRAFTPETEVASNRAKIVLTAVNDPGTVLFDSGEIFLTREGSLLIAVIPSAATAGSTSPFSVVIMTGIGAGLLIDRNAVAEVQVVNAAPGTYALDVFVNDLSVDNSTRQECDPLTTETGTLLEVCAQPFTALSGVQPLAAGNYDVKVQKTADPAVAAQALAGSFAAGSLTNMLLTGLTEDTATTTAQNLQLLVSAQRVATAAQLRVVNASLAADAAVAGDPTSDRLELYITAPGADLAAEGPDFVNLSLGADTGYLQQVPGSYQLVLARTDTAATGVPPEVLFTRDLQILAGGVYTLVIIDSVGAVQPLQSLSLEDDPTP
jgi:hypothetical protein